MNQILVNEKIYSTPELKRKKKFYKKKFIEIYNLENILDYLMKIKFFVF